jgi:hypothetical protein
MLELILTLICLTGTFSNATQDVSWKELTSDEGRFTVSLPGELQQTRVMVTNTRKGTYYTHLISSTDEGLNQYTVAWTDRQKESIEQGATEQTFDKVRDGLLIANKAKLVSESADQLEGYPSRMMTLMAADGRLITARFSFVKNRFYELMAQIRTGDKESGERFLNSFKLLRN